MDELKKYLRDQAAGMDFDRPRTQVWEQVEASLQAPVKQPAIPWLRVAAAAMVIVLAGAALWWMQPASDTLAVNKKPAPVVPAQPQPDAAVPAPAQRQAETGARLVAENKSRAKSRQGVRKAEPAMADLVRPAVGGPAMRDAMDQMTSGFRQVVNVQLEKLRTIPLYGESAEYYSSFKEQFRQLERDEQDLKKELSQNGFTDQRLNELIRIYQEKINILKQLQNEINKTNSRYRLHHPVDQNTQTAFIDI